jgi:FAD:protein FMN transferase
MACADCLQPMLSCSLPPSIERARPLLGTVVAVRVRGAATRAAERAIDCAFAAMSEIHRLMSFHEHTSDISRMNRQAARAPVVVHPHTFRVLAWAARMAQLSQGLFDASIGSTLVEWGLLASPDAVALPDPHVSFRDIELRCGREVFFRRPLWIDLGGIAKGYAVDRAVAALHACGIGSACVNAGGDLRVVGAETEHVAIRTAEAPVGFLPVLELRAGALASSCGASSSRSHAGERVSVHVSGRTRRPVDVRVTVSVLARRCVIADALTKIVLADEAQALPLLRRFRAVAHLHHPNHPGSGWRTLGALQ